MEDLQRARAPRAYVLTAEGSDFVAPPACATLPPFPLHPASAPFRLHLHPQAAVAMLAEVLRVIGYRLAEANRLQHKFPSLAAEMRADAARLERLSIKLKAMRDAGRLYISKDDIPPIEFSLWRWILTRGSEGAMIRFTGLSRALFNELVLLASQAEGWTERVDYYAAPGAGGKRKRGGQLLMGGADCMALALRYIFGYVAHHVEQLRARCPSLSPLSTISRAHHLSYSLAARASRLGSWAASTCRPRRFRHASTKASTSSCTRSSGTPTPR